MISSRVLLVGFACSASTFLSAQSTAITFSASIDGLPVPIDSIWVKNATAGGDTMLYTPDTVMVLDMSTGMGRMGSILVSGSSMEPAAPNPFDGSTRLKVNVAGHGALSLTVYDAVGRVLASMQRTVDDGTHTFYYAGGPQGLAFAEARWKGQRTVQRLLNMNGGYEPDLRYLGWNGPETGRPKDGWFTWQLGDSLFYIVYASGPYGYTFSASSGEVLSGSSTPVVDLLPGLVCADSPIAEDIDGHIYPVVQIGAQCWMAENLKTTRYRDGAAIPNVTDSAEWNSYLLTTGAWCYYENDPANDALYGKLYNAYAAANPNTCPDGWHVPSLAEWGQLIDYLGGEDVAGGRMKVTGTNDGGTGLWDAPNVGATNESGFSAQPGGWRSFMNEGNSWYEVFEGLGRTRGLWWVSSEGEPWVPVWSHGLNSDSESINTYHDSPSHGMSIRCLRNMDCAGVIDGMAYIDDCGICAGGTTGIDPNATCTQDCNGVWAGTAYIDNCGTCSGGTTGLIPCSQDCAGVWGGTAIAGTPCDDGNASTVNDVYRSDCVCAGYDDLSCGSTVSDIDGNLYTVVQIGSQCWITENLRTTHFLDGSVIPTVTTPSSQWGDANTQASPASCSINNNVSNDAVYGRLYNWFVVSDPRLTCPAGWRVPTDGDWKALETTLGMPIDELNLSGHRGETENVGGAMKEISGLWDSPNVNATNSGEFNGRPGGYRSFSGSFNDEGVRGLWWSSSSYSTISAYARYLYGSTGSVFREYTNKGAGYSIRCVRE